MNRAPRIVKIAIGASTGIALAAGLTIGLALWTQSMESKSDAAQAPGNAGIQLIPAGENQNELPVLFDSPKFELTNQDGQKFGSSELAGHVWVADFIFTQCAGLCPMMSARMQKLQSQLPGNVWLVSFSVDPDHDTPAALKAYGEKYNAQDGRWYFLTGPAATIASVENGMKTYAQPATHDSPIQHSSYLLLVDSNGKVRGVYDSNADGEANVLVHDAEQLVSGR